MKNKLLSTPIIALLLALFITGCGTNASTPVKTDEKEYMIITETVYHLNDEEIKIPDGITLFERDRLFRNVIDEILEEGKYTDLQIVFRETPEETSTVAPSETTPEATPETTPETTSEVKRTDWTFVNQSGFDYETCLATQAEYDKIPSHIVNTLLNRGWTFYLTANDLGDEGTWHVSGISYAGSRKENYVRGDDGMGITESTIHEVGHSVDAELGWISNTSEFRSIYNAEVGNFNIQDSHTVGNVSEYFAEAFAQIIKNPDAVSSRVPKTYSFIKNVIDTFGTESAPEPEKTYTFNSEGEAVPSNSTTTETEYTGKIYTFNSEGVAVEK